MNDTLIFKYLKEKFTGIKIRKPLYKAISFFLEASIQAESLVPVKVGSKTKTALPYNGVKRVNRLLKNKFFTQAWCREIYQPMIKKLTRNENEIILAMDWTIINDKYCFLSVSWVKDNGRSIPLYFDGYEKKKLDFKGSQTSGRSYYSINT